MNSTIKDSKTPYFCRNVLFTKRNVLRIFFGKNNPFISPKMKRPWKIFLYMLISFGCSDKIAEDNETFLAEPNKTSNNLTTLRYEIAHFNDTNAEVRKLLCIKLVKDKKIFNRILLRLL